MFGIKNETRPATHLLYIIDGLRVEYLKIGKVVKNCVKKIFHLINSLKTKIFYRNKLFFQKLYVWHKKRNSTRDTSIMYNRWPAGRVFED